MGSVDTFSADTVEQASIERQLRALISKYEDEIVNIRNTYNSMNMSNAWKDTSIKDNFLNTINSYIISFDNLKSEMTSQVDELSRNTSEIDSIESAYS